MKKSQEEIDQHLKKIQEIKNQIGRRTGSFFHCKTNGEKDLFKTLSNRDIKNINKNGDKVILEALKENKIPFDFMYHKFGPEKYFKITHSKSSKYSTMYKAEMHLLTKLADTTPQHINKHIIDIGCGDGIKLFTMLQHAIKNNKIDGTIDYLGLDDSQDMLNFAKKRFYQSFYPKMENISGTKNNIMKKVRPRFQKKRIQEIEGIADRSPKTIFFIGGTIGGGLSPKDQVKFFQDMEQLMQKEDTLVLGYFPVMESPKRDSKVFQELKENYFQKEVERYKNFDVSYHEKEIDIKNMKHNFPGIEVGQDDFDISLEYDEENSIIYDIKTFNKDIFYMGMPVINKGQQFKSEGTKLDDKFFEEGLKHTNKHFTESLYSTKQNDEMIHEFVRHLGVKPDDYFIEKEYNEETNIFEMFLVPIKHDGIEFQIKTNGHTQKIKKYPKDKILLHQSQRFSKQDITDKVEQAGLEIVDELGEKANLIANEDVYKLIVIKKKQ